MFLLQVTAAAALPQVCRRRPTSSRRASGRGRVGRDCCLSQADKLASIDGMRAEVKKLRAIWVAAGGGDAGGG